MPNEVLAETGPLAPGTELQLIYDGGGVTDTRGVVSRLPQSAGEVVASFGDSGLCAWTPTPAREDRVEYVGIVESLHRHRVIHADRVTGALHGGIDRDTTRYMIQDAGEVYDPGGHPTAARDFLAADFNAGDFA